MISFSSLFRTYTSSLLSSLTVANMSFHTPTLSAMLTGMVIARVFSASVNVIMFACPKGVARFACKRSAESGLMRKAKLKFPLF